MKFIKKNWVFLLLAFFVSAILLQPDLREFAKRQIFMKPALDKLDKDLTFSAEELNLELKGINVPDANLSDFKDKAVFLNFWGTWCPPCREEYPSIQKLYEARKDKMHFVLIAMQDQEETVVKFLKDNGYTTPVYVAKSPIAEKMLPKSFPTTYVLAQNGRILQKEESAKDWSTDDVFRFIDSVTQ